MDYSTRCRTVPAALLLLVVATHAQQVLPQFEVASVKPAAMNPGQVGPASMSGRFKVGPQIHQNTAEYTFMTLRQLVAEAYQVLPFQIVGPDWFIEDRFDIVAKLPAGGRGEDARFMLQSLLRDRFGLALHRDNRTQPVTALIVAEGRSNLTRLTATPPESRAGARETPPKQAQRKNENTPFGGIMGNVAVSFTIDDAKSSVRFEANRCTMFDLARFLTNFGAGNGGAVLNMTDVDGEYDIALDIPLSLFGQRSVSDGSASTGTAPAPADYASAPGTATVMRSLRLYGLDLKRRNAPVEYLVVDRVERKPREN